MTLIIEAFSIPLFSFVSITLINFPGNPKPRLTWWRGVDQLDYTYEEYEDTVKNTLWIDNLQRSNMDDELTCKAENSNLTKPVYFNVSINLHGKKSSSQIGV